MLGARRFLKFAHEVGGVGLMGAAAAQLVLSLQAEGSSPAEYATMRHAIVLIADYLLVPSLLLTLLSGLLAMAVHPPFHNAAWAWIKVATTIIVMEGTLLSVSAPAKHLDEIAAEVAAGNTEDADKIDAIERHERGGAGVLVFLCAANIALAVWRPRIRRARGASAAGATAPSDGPPAPS